jgi:hypothetical protein
MARNFKAEEEELDLWFDDQKEIMTKQYLKRVEDNEQKFKESEDDEGEQEKKQVFEDPLVIKNDFLRSSRQLRRKYQARYDKISKDRRIYLLRKKIMDKTLSPFLKIWLRSYAGLIEFYHLLISFFKVCKNSIRFLHDKLNLILYLGKEKYIFAVRPSLMPVLWPMRVIVKRIIKPIRKAYDSLIEHKKNIIDGAIKKVSKTIESIVKVAKKIWGRISGAIKKISDKINKTKASVSNAFNKVSTPIMQKIKEIIKERNESKKKE